ncbi:MAG: HEAT repeat domain-containing protein [Nitrospirae bacterium]|nr:HEAT repeat domain-containing protein [Nitrospirota bacterium]NTW67115.1 HEAT repeat domain-containing protein [Nitrospirota bacterium]
MIPDEELSKQVQMLTDPDPSVRRAAAEALGDSDERAIYPLIKALHDENTGVQDAAMRSLTAIGGEVTAYMAIPLLREGPFLRNTARIILRQIGRHSVPLLRPLFADKDDDIRTFAVDLVADIGWCDYPQDIVRLLETDPNQNTRTAAARALGLLDYREGLPALLAALKDNEWVCFSALESLALMRDESSVDAVLALLGNPSETLRYAAIETLGKIGSRRSSDMLIARLPKASDMEKTSLIRSLVQIGVTPAMAEVADLLVEMYRSGDWDDRLIALTGLRDLKYGRAVPTILDIAGSLEPSDPDSEERLAAVKTALAKFGCGPLLSEFINDPEAGFRSQVIAVEVIGQLRCADAVPTLIKILEGDLREVRRAAVLALAGMPGEETLRVLRKCVDDRDGHVRNAALSVLGRMRDQDSFDHLLRHLDVENYKDVLEVNVQALLQIDSRRLFAGLAALAPAIREIIARSTSDADMLLTLSQEQDVNVRVAALSNLNRVQDGRGQQRLTEALGDSDPEVRKTAVIALGSMNLGPATYKKALADTDMWVRLYAVRALGDSMNPDAAKAVIPLLYDREPPVVLSAIDALVQLGNSEAVTLSALQNHANEQVRERIAQIMEQTC